MKNYKIMKMAKAHSLSAVNRVEFQKKITADEPIRMLAAAVLLQTAIDCREDRRYFYWYHGQKIAYRNEMDEDDYQFYADLAGIGYSRKEFYEKIKRNEPRLWGHSVRDAAAFLLNGKENDNED